MKEEAVRVGEKKVVVVVVGGGGDVGVASSSLTLLPFFFPAADPLFSSPIVHMMQSSMTIRKHCAILRLCLPLKSVKRFRKRFSFFPLAVLIEERHFRFFLFFFD